MIVCPLKLVKQQDRRRSARLGKQKMAQMPAAAAARSGRMLSAGLPSTLALGHPDQLHGLHRQS